MVCKDFMCLIAVNLFLLSLFSDNRVFHHIKVIFKKKLLVEYTSKSSSYEYGIWISKNLTHMKTICWYILLKVSF